MGNLYEKWRSEPILGDDSVPVADAIINDSNTAIAINYAPQLERIAASLEKIASVIDSEGVVFKDKYASLSYSSLIKVFEEEGIDIDALIAKTQNKLSGL